MIIRHYGGKMWLLPTHPQGWVSGHVDSKWFIAFLQATHTKVLQRTRLATQVQPPHLVHPDTDHRQQAWETCGKMRQIKLWPS